MINQLFRVLRLSGDAPTSCSDNRWPWRAQKRLGGSSNPRGNRQPRCNPFKKNGKAPPIGPCRLIHRCVSCVASMQVSVGYAHQVEFVIQARPVVIMQKN